jgi:hypothetical protein
MYGAIIVKDTKENYDIDKNKVIIFGEDQTGAVFVNGKKQPDTLSMKKGINYHFRIVNITAGWADIETSIKQNDKPVSLEASCKRRSRSSFLSTNNKTSIKPTSFCRANT